MDLQLEVLDIFPESGRHSDNGTVVCSVDMEVVLGDTRKDGQHNAIINVGIVLEGGQEAGSFLEIGADGELENCQSHLLGDRVHVALRLLGGTAIDARGRHSDATSGSGCRRFDMVRVVEQLL